MLTNRADRFANYQRFADSQNAQQNGGAQPMGNLTGRVDPIGRNPAMSRYMGGFNQQQQSGAEAPQDNKKFGEDYYRSMYARAEGMNPEQRRNLEMQSAKEQGFYQGPQSNTSQMRGKQARRNPAMSRYTEGFNQQQPKASTPAPMRSRSNQMAQGYQSPQKWAPATFPEQSNNMQRRGGQPQNMMMRYQGSMDDFIN